MEGRRGTTDTCAPTHHTEKSPVKEVRTFCVLNCFLSDECSYLTSYLRTKTANGACNQAVK